jgi:hypothetical protein
MRCREDDVTRFTVAHAMRDSAPYAREVLFDAMVSPLLHASLRLLSLSGAPGHSTLPRAALRRDQLSNLELSPPNPLDYDARCSAVKANASFLSRVRLVCWLTSNLDMPHDPRLGCCTYCRSCCRPCRHIVAIPIAPASRHVFIKFACKISSTPSSTLHNSSTTAQRATEFLCTVKTACQKLSVHLMKRRLELSALGKRHRALS